VTGSSWDRDKARDIGGNCETYLHEHKNIQRKIKGHQRQDDVQLMRQFNLAAALISTELSHKNDSETFTSGRDQLLLLMNLTPFPASLSDKSANTRRVIEKANDAEALYWCIPEIADLTSAMKLQLQSEIDDLRSFLRSTVERLIGLETQIKQSNDFHNESVDNGFNLERNLGTRTKGMLSDIEDEEDIGVIKNAVSSRLDEIDSSLKNFVALEDQRHQQARDKIDHMVTALRDLESEATELRDNLEKQHDQILVNPLTAIPNRAGYDEYVNKEYQRWSRYQSDLTLAVIDLDIFKDINDSYGHAAGDKVSATVSQ
jgi:diguanylate cyclase